MWTHYFIDEEEIAKKVEECLAENGAKFAKTEMVQNSLTDICALDDAEHQCKYCAKLKEEGIRLCLYETLLYEV